jgi:U3 small nucleolar RNA-associated protein 21
VTALEQSPAVDTIAMGTNQGAVYLVNLRHDKKLFSLRHKGRDGSTVSVTSISFRNDGSAMHYGIAPMAVGRSDGNITVWDLTPPDEDNQEIGRSILCEMDRVHPGGVAKLQYLPQEPLLLSTGKTSNSILMHIFDSPDHSARLLRQRKGHTAPPCKIRYLHAGAGGGGGILANASDGTDASSSCQLLSSGGPDRTLRVFSTVRTVLDKEYSQGKGLQKKQKKLGLESMAELLLPPLTGMAMCEARSRDWGDLVTIHQNHAFAYVWSTRQGAQSGPVLRQEHWNVSAMKQAPPPGTNATSIAISACGNFALVGTKGGTIYRYNIQSGIPRGSYPRDATDKKDDSKKFKPIGDVNRTMKALEKKMKNNNRKANLDKEVFDAEIEAKREQQLRAKLRSASHSGFAVTGLAVDAVNKTLISVGSDSKLILWNFATHSPHKKSPYILPCPATQLCLVRDSDLAAIALEDFSVVLFDCSALSIVRRFGKGSAKHTGAISDLSFSPDGRNLYTASLDSTIRVWDVPANTCVDYSYFEEVAMLAQLADELATQEEAI